MNTDEEAETNVRKPEGISDSAMEAPKGLGQSSRRRWQADSVVDQETGSVYHTPNSFSGVGDVEEQVVLAKGQTSKPEEDVAAPKPFGDIQDVTAKKMLSEIGV